ncbi:hypothetical protein PC121_g25475 [Phytophthora cactorum]|nr:hypothetical protein PC121_g25475 [Phytophthora cactorum]
MKVQTQFGKKVKFVRHDGAREFATNSLKAFYQDEGIEQQTTVPYAHQTNGTAERAIRTIVTIGRSMLHHAKLDKCFWAEAVMTVMEGVVGETKLGRSGGVSTLGENGVEAGNHLRGRRKIRK